MSQMLVQRVQHEHELVSGDDQRLTLADEQGARVRLRRLRAELRESRVARAHRADVLANVSMVAFDEWIGDRRGVVVVDVVVVVGLVLFVAQLGEEVRVACARCGQLRRASVRF